MSKHRFVWKAVDVQGTVKKGKWMGDNLSEVRTRLKNDGYLPVTIKPYKNRFGAFVSFRSKVQWGHSARRLASLLEAGIPLLQALEIITPKRGKLSIEQKQWICVKDQVVMGYDLSEALNRLNPAPNSYVLSMIKAGEYSGSLGKTLNEVADELEQEEAFRQKMQTALAYPILLLIAVLVVLCVLSTSVLPMYERLFLSMGAELPILTKVIFIGGRKLPIVLESMVALLGGGLLCLRLWKPKDWKKRLKNGMRYLPFLGRIYRLSDLVQFTRVLGRLLATGIPLLEALRLTAGTLQSSEMIELTEQLIQSVRQGNRMANLLYASKVFPKEGAEMIAVAEETGQLDKMLSHVTRLIKRNLEYQLERFTHLLEPALILFLAGLIGLVAGGVMVPIFELSSHLE